MSTAAPTRLFPPVSRLPFGAIGLGLLLLAEILAATTWLDGATLAGSAGLASLIGSYGAWALRFGIGFLAAFIAFAGLEGRLDVRALLRTEPSPRWMWLALHGAAMLAFIFLSSRLYTSPADSGWIAALWLLAAATSVGTLVLSYAPIRFWQRILLDSGAAPWLAIVVSGVGVAAVRLSQSMWQYAAQWTFSLVQIVLRPIIPTLTADPSRMLIRGRKFGVIISQECSGLEGIGLMLVFSLAWLWLYRREFRFPRAYLLVPIGVVTLYLLNAVRIAALLLIGDAGAREIAAGGFHSQAGWIAFNAVALCMTLVVPRISWFMQRPRTAKAVRQGQNPTAAYLLPFLAILATAMFTRAASANFDWLYAARFFAVIAVLWLFRDRLRNTDWRFGWIGISAGLGVFLLWIGMDQWQGLPFAAMPADLSKAADLPRTLWIVFRALAATTTVPIAEELAFRGFGMRQFSGTDFEQVTYRHASWIAILVSSVCFGLLHGDRWIAGILSGFAFAFAARSRDRLGEAVAAHAVANALLGAWVLYTGEWQYW